MTTEHSASGDVNSSLALLWDMHKEPSRGPKRGLNLGQIVTTAVGVADKEGLAAVSMRRIATELGVGTMTLYRYVPGRAELLDLMLDHVDRCVDPRELNGTSWREWVEVCARGSWALYLQHPWLVQVDRSRPLLGPNALLGFEMYMTGLADTGLTDQEKVAVISTVDAYTVGLCRYHIFSLQAEERTGMSDEEFWAAQEPVLIKAMETGNYPTLSRLSDDAFAQSYEQTFEFGLQRILDGIAVLIDDRRQSSQARPIHNP